MHRLALSVDLEEWYHSGRWVDREQAHAVPDTTALWRRLYGTTRPRGEIVPPTRALLDIFDRSGCRATFFVLGEVARCYPDLVREIAGRGHEIACHGLRHVDMTVPGPARFAEELDEATSALERLTGGPVHGYRAPNLVFAAWATRLLEARGFLYDSTVVPSRPLGGKYRGWAQAPTVPYHPSYEDVARRGRARLLELPLPVFPGIRLAAGSGITMRVFGFHWTFLALRYAARRGPTGFYCHPWEIGPRPPREGHRLKNAIFLRHTGPWMVRALERILHHFRGRVVTAGEVARQVLLAEAQPRPSAPVPESSPVAP